MSCWVVPAVAAEIWGLSLAQVLEKIKAGSLPAKLELGFTLVDVAPNGPRIESGLRPPAAKPRTWTEVQLSAAELAALTGTPLASHRSPRTRIARPSFNPIAQPQPQPEPNPIPPPDAENAAEFYEEGQFDWRKRRQEISRTRRRPGAPAMPLRRRPAAA